jgi:hypothetical protein
MGYWPPLEAKTLPPRSLPHPENESQWCDPNCSSCIMANINVASWKSLIYDVLAAVSSETMHYPIMKMNVNGASTIFGLEYWVIKALRQYISSYQKY